MPQPMANATDKCSVMLIIITAAKRSFAIYRDDVKLCEQKSKKNARKTNVLFVFFSYSNKGSGHGCNDGYRMRKKAFFFLLPDQHMSQYNFVSSSAQLNVDNKCIESDVIFH